MSKVLSLDQSTTRSGFCAYTNGKYDHSGVIDKHKNKDLESRFKEMYEGIHNLIAEEEPDIVVIEDTQAQAGNMGTYKILCQLQGAIMGMCYAMGIRFYVMPPVKWRSILGYRQGPKVKRTELKEQSLEFVKKEFGFVKSEDENEACAICAAFHRMNNAEGIDIE